MGGTLEESISFDLAAINRFVRGSVGSRGSFDPNVGEAGFGREDCQAPNINPAAVAALEAFAVGENVEMLELDINFREVSGTARAGQVPEKGAETEEREVVDKGKPDRVTMTASLVDRHRKRMGKISQRIL